MSYAHRRARLVHVLSTRTGRAINIDSQILVADLDVDLFVHYRIDEHRRETRMPARVGVERRDTNQAMHARLWPQKSVGVQPANLQHRTLDAGFFAFALVEDTHLEAAALGPSCVHAHQHLCPVLGFGATGAGADLQLRIAEIIRPAQQRFHLE